MVLEGVMIILTCLCLTVWHPGWVLKNGLVSTADGSEDIEGCELIGVRGKINGGVKGTGGYVNIGK